MISVRLATLQDTAAITEIHKSTVMAWERINAQGQLLSVSYDELSLYERWQHGGPWMSVETCAVHLNRLLAGSGIPLVAELDGQVLAETEVYEGYEAMPFGHHLNISVLYTHAAHTRQGLGRALIDYIQQMAKLMGCQAISVTDVNAPEFYTKAGFRHTRSGRRVRIATQAGRAFYQTSELTDRSPEQIRGWYMPLGRYQSGRQEWEHLFPQDWAAGIPELLNVPMAHLKLTVAGQNALVFLREATHADSQPGECSLSCWSARPLTPPLLTALRDRAFREGFHTIVTYVIDSDWLLLSNEASPTDYRQDFYELAVPTG